MNFYFMPFLLKVKDNHECMIFYLMPFSLKVKDEGICKNFSLMPFFLKKRLQMPFFLKKRLQMSDFFLLPRFPLKLKTTKNSVMLYAFFLKNDRQPRM